MITSKLELCEYLKIEKRLYLSPNMKDRLLQQITEAPNVQLWKFVNALRHAEYHFNNRSSSLYHSLMYILWLRFKYRLGFKLGLEIPENTCGKGLLISHTGNIVINGYAKLGEFCVLHGANCIGNTGRPGEYSAPILGNRCDVGVGASVIGDISIADGTVIGAGAVVVKSSSLPDGLLVGVPARPMKN